MCVIFLIPVGGKNVSCSLSHVAIAMRRRQVVKHSPVHGLLGVSPAAIVVDNAGALEAPAVASVQAAGCHIMSWSHSSSTAVSFRMSCCDGCCHDAVCFVCPPSSQLRERVFFLWFALSRRRDLLLSKDPQPRFCVFSNFEKQIILDSYYPGMNLWCSNPSTRLT